MSFAYSMELERVTNQVDILDCIRLAQIELPFSKLILSLERLLECKREHGVQKTRLLHIDRYKNDKLVSFLSTLSFKARSLLKLHEHTIQNFPGELFE